MAGVADYLRRTVGPSTVVRLSRWRAPLRLRAAMRRALGKGPGVKLFFAYDDPYAAIALPGLMRLAAQHRAQLELYPLREHGIDGDPAAQQRRVHAVTDSRRLAKRQGRELSRLTPPDPRDYAAARGKALYDGICVACHGPAGKGDPKVGAPDLTDAYWLYGDDNAALRESIDHGRHGRMPAHRALLGETRARLVGAYVWSLSHADGAGPDAGARR